MDSIYAGAKQQARSLRAALSAQYGLNLSHGQALDLVAQGERHDDWNTLHANLFKTWAYRRHEAYLPNSADVVRGLSVKQAVRDDLLCFKGDSDWVVREALKRMFGQLNLARHNGLRVEPEMKAAFVASDTQTLDELQQRERDAKSNFEAFNADHVQLPLSSLNASRYQQLYVTWRLATLSLSLSRCQRTDSSLFLSLEDRKLDLYEFLALVLNGGSAQQLRLLTNTALEELLSQQRNSRPQDRGVAKYILLSYLATGEAPRSLPSGLPSKADAARSLQALELNFPEVSLWHAWAELKPLLAQGADTAYAGRN